MSKIKIISSILILILLFSLFGTYMYLNSSKKVLQSKKEEVNLAKEKMEDLKNKLSSAKNTLSEIKKELEDSRRYLVLKEEVLQKLKQGNIYELHDPFYEDVVDFLKKSSSEGCKSSYCIVNRAKENGIRCAYVEILVNDGYYPAIRFDTLDRGTVYFSPETLDQFDFSSLNEKIKDIIVIW